MLNFNVNVKRKLIVCGEGKVKLQNCFGRHLNGYVLCLSLQKCKDEGIIPKHSNSILFKYMFQLRLTNYTLVGRQLVTCDAMFGF